MIVKPNLTKNGGPTYLPAVVLASGRSMTTGEFTTALRSEKIGSADFDLRGATFQNVDGLRIDGGNLGHDLDSVRFLNCADIELVGVRARGASFVDSHIALIADSELPQANLQSSTLESARVYNTDLQGAAFTSCTLTHADIEASSMQNATMRESTITASKLRGVELSGTTLTRTTVRDTLINQRATPEQPKPIVGAAWTHLDLHGVQMRGVRLQDSHLAHTTATYDCRLDIVAAGDTVVRDVHGITTRTAAEAANDRRTPANWRSPFPPVHAQPPGQRPEPRPAPVTAEHRRNPWGVPLAAPAPAAVPTVARPNADHRQPRTVPAAAVSFATAPPGPAPSTRHAGPPVALHSTHGNIRTLAPASAGRDR